MSMLAKSPFAKSSTSAAWSGGGSNCDCGEPLVLIRLRDMSCPDSVIESVAARPVVAEAEVAPPPEVSCAAVLPVFQAKVESPGIAAGDSKVDAKVPLSDASSEANAEPDSAATANPPTPARRSRQRRETPAAKRDWSHTLWQGTVGVLLVAMFVIVYFIMVGGNNKNNTAGPAETEDNHPAPEGLEGPEISIPTASEETPDPASAPTFEPELKTAESDSPEAEYPVTAQEPSAVGSRSTGEFSSSETAESGEFEPRANSQIGARPNMDASAYPVTPAHATYPPTDPGRFRYPDYSRSTRPVESSAPSGRQTVFPSPAVSPWIERHRLGGGPPGGEFQPSTKMR